MAIGRLSMKVGKAGKAGPHAAYIARTGEYAKRLERGEKLEATEAGNLPAWAQVNPLEFWWAADTFERSNGTTYREMEIALPRELDAGQRTALVREFVRQEIGDRHAYQWAIHTPRAADGGEQPHVHLMFSERQVDGLERDPEQYFRRYNAKHPERGGARKGYGPHAGQTLTRADRAADLKGLRERWEAMANQHLERAGRAERIDMGSHAERGTGLEPERKQLPSAWRDASQRALVIEFRAARRDLQAARAELRRVVPNDHAEVITQVLSLEIERKRRQEAAQEAQETAPSISDTDLPREWERSRNGRAAQIRQRADKLAERIEEQRDQIQTQRHEKRQAHAAERPKEPNWLLAAFKRAAYEQACAMWEVAAKRIEGWRIERERTLEARLERLKGYCTRDYLPSYPNKAERRAERQMRAKHPDLARRLDALLEQQPEQRKAQFLERQRQKQLRRGHKPRF